MSLLKKSPVPAFLALFLLAAGPAFAAPEDGFGSAEKSQGAHFTVYYNPQLSGSGLARQIGITSSDRVLAGKSAASGVSLEAELGQAADVLFLLVCDALDMQLYSYKGKIKVCVDEQQLKGIYRNLFGQEYEGPIHSFYVFDNNTIYITRDSFNRKVLGHEVAHAVISNYFVVQPSVKVQEVLAGYVEYQLRKSGQ